MQTREHKNPYRACMISPLRSSTSPLPFFPPFFMSDNGSGMSAIVAIVAVIAIIAVGYVAVMMLNGDQSEPGINVDVGGDAMDGGGQ